ncbi:MAG: pyridoxamine 5'-phosphate oxidase family protein [Alphaproteobacteria bacterium]|nr:pyridoxamine 5'-phosphate oxidase family protein [Alphaproteobacteria bacterium]
MDDATSVPPHAVTSAAELREIFGSPSALAAVKVIPALDAHCRNFIALSPFLVIASTSRDGRADASPKGDPPGFVKVLDDRTLAIPDRLGNNRIDTFLNVVENPEIGLIFFVPGVEETLRVNGRAVISRDPTLLSRMVEQGKTPKVALVVSVREAYLHCAKALKRSRLWDPAAKVPRTALPSLARMILDQAKRDDPVEEVEARIEDAYRTKLY